MCPGKFTAEFIKIYGLVIMFCIGKTEFFAWDHGFDIILIREDQTGSIHPGLVFCSQGKTVSWIISKAV